MKKAENIEAVILGADVNGLGIVRSLGKMGIRSFVVCAEKGKHDLAIFSKYCASSYVPRKMKVCKSELICLLTEMAKVQVEKPVLYATSDYFVNFIVSNREKLKDHYLFNIPENEIVELVTNKSKINNFASNTGIHTPKTLQMQDLTSLDSISQLIGFPCIIKPHNSYAFDFPGKNKIIYNKAELASFIEEFPHLRHNIILQEVIPGGEANIFQCTAYIGKHVPTQLFTMQKLRQFPPGYGVTSLGRSLSEKTLMMSTRKLLENIGYTGFASVEYKKSDLNQNYYLIEINPRLPWYNAMFSASGVNFAFLAYVDLKQSSMKSGSPKFGFKQTDNIHWMHLKYELRGFWQRRLSGIGIKPIGYFKEILNARSFAYFDSDDPKPYFKADMELAKWILRKILKRSQN